MRQKIWHSTFFIFYLILLFVLSSILYTYIWLTSSYYRLEAIGNTSWFLLSMIEKGHLNKNTVCTLQILGHTSENPPTKIFSGPLPSVSGRLLDCLLVLYIQIPNIKRARHTKTKNFGSFVNVKLKMSIMCGLWIAHKHWNDTSLCWGSRQLTIFHADEKTPKDVISWEKQQKQAVYGDNVQAMCIQR